MPAVASRLGDGGSKSSVLSEALVRSSPSFAEASEGILRAARRWLRHPKRSRVRRYLRIVQPTFAKATVGILRASAKDGGDGGYCTRVSSDAQANDYKLSPLIGFDRARQKRTKPHPCLVS